MVLRLRQAAKLQASLVSWRHPEGPLDAATVAALRACGSGLLAQRLAAWRAALHSLYSTYRTGQCRTFLVTHTVRTAGHMCWGLTGPWNLAEAPPCTGAAAGHAQQRSPVGANRALLPLWEVSASSADAYHSRRHRRPATACRACASP